MRSSDSGAAFADRLLSCLSYLTAGWGGIIALFLLYLKRRSASPFLRFNAFQSIFIALLFFVISMVFGLLASFLKFIPLLNSLVAYISFLLNRPLFFNWSAVQVVMLGITIYGAVFSIIGRYPRIIWISKIVDYNVR